MKIEVLEKLKKTELMLLSNWAFIKNKEINSISNYQFKINKIIKKFLQIGQKFIPELHLKQPGFTLLVDHVLNIMKEFKNLEKQDI